MSINFKANLDHEFRTRKAERFVKALPLANFPDKHYIKPTPVSNANDVYTAAAHYLGCLMKANANQDNTHQNTFYQKTELFRLRRWGRRLAIIDGVDSLLFVTECAVWIARIMSWTDDDFNKRRINVYSDLQLAWQGIAEL